MPLHRGPVRLVGYEAGSNSTRGGAAMSAVSTRDAPRREAPSGAQAHGTRSRVTLASDTWAHPP